MMRGFGFIAVGWLWLGSVLMAQEAEQPPNIVVVLTDDQGYADLGAHGHPFLKTPHLDRLHAASVRFTDWSVCPTCAPTRAALLTGRHEMRSGITHTVLERERLALSATTLPQVLKAAGYATGIFGKWHLGDEEPYQPQNRGFGEVFIHGAGGIGQTYEGSCGDAPKNSYFDPVILHNGKFVKTKGFCTDVFFAQAMQWIDQRAKADPNSERKPFFCWLATNAPHAPLHCPEEWAAPYRDKAKKGQANFFGMIANIDDNVGKLLAKLAELGIEGETLVIFLNDNGSAFGAEYFNAGMRGSKGSPFRGGTRGMSLWHWPGKLSPGDCDAVTAHIDLFPTLVELSQAPVSDEVRSQLEGFSLVPLLKGPEGDWPEPAQRDRHLFTHVARWQPGTPPQKYGPCSMRWHKYLYLPKPEGGQLYDLKADPGETTDIAEAHPQIVEQLSKTYDQWWKNIQPDLVNEQAYKSAPKINTFKELYWRQYAGPGPNNAPPPDKRIEGKSD
jgi:arylsulfatase